jgi:LysM repeat protein
VDCAGRHNETILAGVYKMNLKTKNGKYHHALLLLAFGLGVIGESFSLPTAKASESVKPACRFTHKVQKGEYLVQIGLQYRADWRQIAEANNIENPWVIYPGEKLCIPQGHAPDVVSPTLLIVSVIAGQTVTVRGEDFPSNVTYNVVMAPANATSGMVQVKQISPALNGTFVETFGIPTSLARFASLNLRLVNPVSGLFVEETFTNEDSGVIPDLIDRQTGSTSKGIRPQQAAEVFLGGGGVYFPNSGYDATVTLTRYDSSSSDTNLGVVFIQQLLEVRLADSRRREIDQIVGLVYLYFNLNKETRADWDSGRLSIYHYDARVAAWIPCPTVLVSNENRPYGRLTCVLQEFGLYGLAKGD